MCDVMFIYKPVLFIILLKQQLYSLVLYVVLLNNPCKGSVLIYTVILFYKERFCINRIILQIFRLKLSGGSTPFLFRSNYFWHFLDLTKTLCYPHTCNLTIFQWYPRKTRQTPLADYIQTKMSPCDYNVANQLVDIMCLVWKVFISTINITPWVYPNKHDTLSQCGFNAGPTSTTLAQHQTHIGSTSRVCWGCHCTDTFTPCGKCNYFGSLSPGCRCWLFYARDSRVEIMK